MDLRMRVEERIILQEACKGSAGERLGVGDCNRVPSIGGAEQRGSGLIVAETQPFMLQVASCTGSFAK